MARVSAKILEPVLDVLSLLLVAVLLRYHGCRLSIGRASQLLQFTAKGTSS
jgi:hypothetical protein